MTQRAAWGGHTLGRPRVQSKPGLSHCFPAPLWLYHPPLSHSVLAPAAIQGTAELANALLPCAVGRHAPPQGRLWYLGYLPPPPVLLAKRSWTWGSVIYWVNIKYTGSRAREGLLQGPSLSTSSLPLGDEHAIPIASFENSKKPGTDHTKPPMPPI